MGASCEERPGGARAAQNGAGGGGCRCLARMSCGRVQPLQNADAGPVPTSLLRNHQPLHAGAEATCSASSVQLCPGKEQGGSIS